MEGNEWVFKTAVDRDFLNVNPNQVRHGRWRKPATYDTVSGFCLDNGVVKEKEWLDWLKEKVDE